MRPVRSSTLLGVVALVLALALAASLTAPIQAHKAVTSPYSYNQDVFPILRDHCGRCHVEGGAAPMSLMTYMDPTTGGAFAWAQSMREMLVSESMPPWFADPRGPAVAHTDALTSRELDIIVTWASGGAPEGDPAKGPAPVKPPTGWPLGKPDLVVTMSAPHVVDADTAQETFEVALPTGLPVARWVKAVDLLPGAASMVRRAWISVAGGTVLRVWEPGDDAPTAPEGTAFRIPARATIQLRIFYKKSWREEHDEKRDRSSVGLYFTRAPASGRGIDALAISGPKTDGLEPVTFSGTLPRAGRVLAVRPSLDRPYRSLDVAAVDASGARVPLLKLHAPRPEWPRRYWLRQPVELPLATTIEITGVPDAPKDGAPPAPADSPLEVSLDFAPL